MAETHDVPLGYRDWEKIPPFPADLPTAPIEYISYASLVHDDPDAVEKLIRTCKSTGFLGLDFSEEGQEFLQVADEAFALCGEAFSLPLEVKLEDAISKNHPHIAGYKPRGSTVLDKGGRRDNMEMYNIICRDIVNENRSTATYNEPLLKAFPDVLKKFSNLGHEVSNKLLSILSGPAALGIDPDGDDYLPNLHRQSGNSATHLRLCKYPAKDPPTIPAHAETTAEELDKNMNLTAHTDWGAVTILFSVIGGLQIYVSDDIPGYEAGWYWVKPGPAHAIINLGDTMTAFSGGTLKSSMHRVVDPPGAQAKFTKYSLAYFLRPENDVLMRPLKGSNIAVADEDDQKPLTAVQWFAERSKWIRGIPPSEDFKAGLHTLEKYLSRSGKPE